MFTYLKKLFTRTPEQRTFCYCPKCRNELCGSRGDMNATSYVKHFDDHTVHYKCVKCGTETRWDFDIFPVAVMTEIKCVNGVWRRVPMDKWGTGWLPCDDDLTQTGGCK